MSVKDGSLLSVWYEAMNRRKRDSTCENIDIERRDGRRR